MPFNLLSNPFVALVDTKPELILRGNREQGLFDESKTKLNAALGSYRNVCVEVGCGSGGHLIERASRSPDTLFIGFELRFKRVFRTAEKAEERGLKNVLVIQHDASLIDSIFGVGSLTGLFILFPDPWEKRRWRKHRILSDSFLSSAAKLLKPGGILHYKTDHREYFEETVKRLGAIPEFSVVRLSRDLHSDPQQSDNIESEFEKLFKSKQLPVFLCELSRV
jgi:tRNA (guanine-N7-)-methyltransferase